MHTYQNEQTNFRQRGRFAEKELEWRRYSTAEALPITQRVELIDKREFAAAALDENAETFVIYVAALSAPTMQVHPSRQAQIGLLLANKAPTKVLPEYSDYADVFSFDLTMELPKNTGMNCCCIRLVREGGK